MGWIHIARAVVVTILVRHRCVVHVVLIAMDVTHSLCNKPAVLLQQYKHWHVIDAWVEDMDQHLWWWIVCKQWTTDILTMFSQSNTRWGSSKGSAIKMTVLRVCKSSYYWSYIKTETQCAQLSNNREVTFTSQQTCLRQRSSLVM